MKRLFAALAFWLLAWSPPHDAYPEPAQSKKCAPQFAPLESGSSVGYSKLPVWLAEQAGSWGGSGWLGWSYDSQALLPMELTVRALPRQSHGDHDEVSVQAMPQLSFAVRCIPALRAGPIVSSDVVNRSLTQGLVKLSIGSRHYEVRLESEREDLGDARVVLAEGTRTQIIYAVRGYADEPVFDVVWAGDLDRDGKCDLITILSRKYSMHPYRLHLSSAASPRQLVGVAAVFETGD